jgi:predicted ATPase/DNA-binding SARP family transcriptional activator
MIDEHVLVAAALQQRETLHITLLGPLQIAYNGQPVHMPRRKVEVLLAYLVLHPERQTRDQLAALFWGDSSSAQARHSLRTALATLRQYLPTDLVLTDRDHVQLNPTVHCWVDLRELLALEQQLETTPPPQLLATLALWRAELLPGLDYEWLLIEREHYWMRLVRLALQTIQTLRTRSEYAAAIALAHHLLTLEPSNEYAHQHLMFCYVAVGDRAAALQQYETCARVLLAEVAAEPLPETTALYQWIKHGNEIAFSSVARKTNLPIPLTSFVGRAHEMTALKGLLLAPTDRRVRLLTLTGAGGSGKTRLAIQVATDLIDRFAGGVWWVDLAAVTDQRLVARNIAQVFGVLERPHEPMLDSLAHAIGTQMLLLLLDNVEHLLAECAQVVATLLQRCPQLVVLLTSREPLNVAGEQTWPITLFAVPEHEQLATPDTLLTYDSVRLLTERAVAVQPTFALTADNARFVAEICQLLDGMPLAIELAAARMKLLSAQQIAGLIGGTQGARFALLTKGSRMGLPRQQTLRATIDWSYALLDAAERQLFCQAAVFRGGFSLEALAHVASVGCVQSDRLATLDRLTQLVDKSLVIVDTHREPPRYRLLETLREYGIEQFVAADLPGVRSQHARFFLDYAEQLAPRLVGAEQQASLALLDLDNANLSQALDYLIEMADGEAALRLATALARFWDYRGYVSAGSEWLRQALAQPGYVTILVRARALQAAGFLALRRGDFDEAHALISDGMDLFVQTVDEVGVAEALQNLAHIAMVKSNYALAETHLTASIQLCQALGYDYGVARGFNILGNLAWDRHQIAVAHAQYVNSLQIFEGLGDRVMIATVHLNIGGLAIDREHLDEARHHFEKCLTIARSLGHAGLIGQALKSLGWLAYGQGDYLQARDYCHEAGAILERLGDRSNLAQVLGTLGDIDVQRGEYPQALEHYRKNLAIYAELDHLRGLYSGFQDLVQLLLVMQQDPELAVRLLAAADAYQRQVGLELAASSQTKQTQASAALRAQLGAATFEQHWQAGQRASLAELLADVALVTSNW